MRLRASGEAGSGLEVPRSDGAGTVDSPDLQQLERTLRRELAGEVRIDAYTRHIYSRDASMYAIEPLAVAFPRDADDVVAAVGVARSLGVPVLPRGAGTSL